MPPNFGQQIQYSKQTDNAPLLDQQQTTFIQEMNGTFLYYTQVVDSTMLTALSAIAMKQATPMTTMMKHTK